MSSGSPIDLAIMSPCDLFHRGFDTVSVQPPIGNLLARLELLLRHPHRIVGSLRLVNRDHPLEHLEGMSVGAQEILEELHTVRGHGNTLRSKLYRSGARLL